MKKIRRKIVLACSAVLTLLITTVTTTFAWFSLNESAWLEKMELEVNNMNNLLITADYDVDASNMMFKQYLTAEDIVAAINKKRELNGEVAINSLDDIKLSPVTSLDGVSFTETKVTYTESNKQELSWVTANPNNYVSMRISFVVENNGADKSDFDLVFVTEDKDGLKGTSFGADNQVITLVNKLVNGAEEKKTLDTLTVNPVNALKMAVTNVTLNDGSVHIYDLGQSDVNEHSDVNLGGLADAANASTNPMFTYYNNVNNFDLPVMEDLAGNVVLHDELDQVLGTFTPVSDSEYSIITLDITIWVEGYDADNIIGLDTSVISMLLTFGANKK